MKKYIPVLLCCVFTTWLHAQDAPDPCPCDAARYADMLDNNARYRTQRAILNLINSSNWSQFKSMAVFAVPRFAEILRAPTFVEFEKQRRAYQAHLTNERIYNDETTLQQRSAAIQFNYWKSCSQQCASNQKDGFFAFVSHEDSSKIWVQIRHNNSSRSTTHTKIGFAQSKNAVVSSSALNKKTGLVELVPNIEVSLAFTRSSGSASQIVITDMSGAVVFSYTSVWSPNKDKGLLQKVVGGCPEDNIRFQNNYAQVMTSSRDCKLKFSIRGIQEVILTPGENRPDVNLICVYKDESNEKKVYEYVIEK